MTQAQAYIKAHGPAPMSLVAIDEMADAIAHWDGRGKLANYTSLKLTQGYRLYGDECVVSGCKQKIDAPKYIMELVGAPTCTLCAQLISLQQLKGRGPEPYEPAFDTPSNDDVEKAKAAGTPMP